MKKTYISPEAYFELMESDNDLLNLSKQQTGSQVGNGDFNGPEIGGNDGQGGQDGDEEDEEEVG